ncbi:hypothetical protein EYF80_043624 [Liparis tanakae]|uniref:Uncharacterized protein n=1 Tax=Liparis tanakae TaxID=230148 RepID=A0A4Z2FZC6_9TELE|nr:hypothetical protein EYF80_043624 [Liparis tanakae]
MTRLAKYDTAASLKKKCIALTPEINQPADSGLTRACWACLASRAFLMSSGLSLPTTVSWTHLVWYKYRWKLGVVCRKRAPCPGQPLPAGAAPGEGGTPTDAHQTSSHRNSHRFAAAAKAGHQPLHRLLGDSDPGPHGGVRDHKSELFPLSADQGRAHFTCPAQHLQDL